MPNAFARLSGNRFLNAMPADVAARLADRAESTPMTRGAVLSEAGASTSEIYFPDRGLISLVKAMSDGRSTQVGYAGIEGLTGVSSLLGVAHSAFEAIVQIEGHATRLKTADIRAEMRLSPHLTDLVSRYMYFKMNQLAQTAACNRLHTLRQHCCRWLLISHENAGADQFTLTHEFLALMMGVNRPSLSLAIASLQRAGLIRYRRASITIVDRDGLEDGACECYRTLRGELDQVYGGHRR